MQMSGFMLARGENRRSAGWIRCRPWPPSEKDMLSLPSTLLRCSGTVCKAHSVIPILKRGSVKYHLQYLTPKQANNLANKNHLLEFNLFSSTWLMETPLICILFNPPPMLAFWKFTLNSPHLPTAPPSPPHFLMQRNNGAALRGCESLPKLCVGGLHSQAAFNIHSFFSDVSARYLGSLRLWRSDLATAKNVKYGGKKKAFQVCISQFGPCHALYVLDHGDVGKVKFSIFPTSCLF